MFFSEVNGVDRPNKKWEIIQRSGLLTVKNLKKFRSDQRFFTIGSCFAEEIRKALTAQDVQCYPNYRKIEFDPNRVIVDTLPKREHMNYYNTFSIRQEFERAAELWVQDDHDVWKLNGRDIQNGQIIKNEGSIYQDPYRRLVFGKTHEDLLKTNESINLIMRQGIKNADAFVITLGMTEVFKKKNNGLVCNQIPVYGGGAGLKETYFHASTYEENIKNMHQTLSLLKQMNDSAEVVLTVSPVPLHRSFSEHDIFVNNMESKSILRAVAGQICREYDWVHYFPSYEIVTGIGRNAYLEKDMLHVKPSLVESIMELFLVSQCE